MATIYTIGFTQKSAEQFFGLLGDAGVKTLVDIRLNNKSQLAGFAKGRDLGYFLRVIHGIDYRYEPMLAPTKEILDDYKKNGGDWDRYVASFSDLLDIRVEKLGLTLQELDGACLLCSEATAEQCHRRLVAERYQQVFPELEVVHLAI